MLRQNRRVVKGDDGDTAERKEELEVFHKILSDVSMGIASERTRTFLTQAYVRGALHCATADHAELEGNTSVFRAVPTPSLHLRLGTWTRYRRTYPARPRCSPKDVTVTGGTGKSLRAWPRGSAVNAHARRSTLAGGLQTSFYHH